MEQPFVSIVIPCRNEEAYISRCMDSILLNDYPKSCLEVLIVDGMSEDGTKKIARKYSEKYSFVRVIDNVKKITPVALNVGIKAARGEILVRMDAHNVYSSDYISKSVRFLLEYDVDNVGGIWETVPGAATLKALSIAAAVSSPFGVGNAFYRLSPEGPMFVDTVPFGCYKKKIFDMIGFFDEDLVRNQDDEFNLRLIKNGGKILLVPEIVSQYYAREVFSKLWKMYWQYGYFKPLVAKKIGRIMTWRQLIPAFFVGGIILGSIFSVFFAPVKIALMVGFILYIAVSMFFSTRSAFSLNNVVLIPYIMWSFLTMHISYGMAYIRGVIDFCVINKTKADENRIFITR